MATTERKSSHSMTNSVAMLGYNSILDYSSYQILQPSADPEVRPPPGTPFPCEIVIRDPQLGMYIQIIWENNRVRQIRCDNRHKLLGHLDVELAYPKLTAEKSPNGRCSRMTYWRSDQSKVVSTPKRHGFGYDDNVFRLHGAYKEVTMPRCGRLKIRAYFIQDRRLSLDEASVANAVDTNDEDEAAVNEDDVDNDGKSEGNTDAEDMADDGDDIAEE